MYVIRKLLGYSRYLTENPLYLKTKGKTLRDIVNKKIFKLLKDQSNKIVSNKKYSSYTNLFDKRYISLFVAHYLRSKIYYKVSKNEILKYLNKNHNNKNIFNFDFVDFIYILKIFMKFFKFIIINFLKKSNLSNFKNCDILIEYLHGNGPNRKDLPIIKDLIKSNHKIKINYLFSSPLTNSGKRGFNNIKKNYISKVKLKELEYRPFYYGNISLKSKKAIFYCIKNFFTNPLIYTIYLDFVMNYEYYFQLLKHLKVKFYVNSTWDQNIPAIRQALKELKAYNIAFQSSYVGNKEDAFLDHANDIIFAWGKNSEKNMIKDSNFIKKIYKINPTYMKNKSKVFTKKSKTITIFDSSHKEDGFISPLIYNKLLNIIIKKVLSKTNLKLCIKHKNIGTQKFIDSKNLLLIDKLRQKKKYQSFVGSEINNPKIIANSALVITINSLTISAEALFNEKDSLNLCNSSVDKNFLLKLNKIHPFAFSNFDQFEKELNIKLNFDKKSQKLKNLKDFFFENDEKKVNPVNYINSFFKKDSFTLR